jgi:putative transcriptional regulator
VTAYAQLSAQGEDEGIVAPDLLIRQLGSVELQQLSWRSTLMFDQMSESVRNLRRELKMTQEEFAHELGITVGTVNRWENGRFRPSKLARVTLAEFAQRHGIFVEEFAARETRNHPPNLHN